MPPRIALLLHMHQPDYRHPDDGVPQLPWVRLHASRGYTDVATLILERCPDDPAHAPTVNVVPSLLEQLDAYGRGATDRWEQLSRLPAESLSPDDAAFVRGRFVHGHPRMREASPRYRDLAARAAELTTPAELRDLQVWSNLSWLGSVGRRDAFVQQLLAQDRDFSHDQLLGLMDRQRALVTGVLDLWRRLPSVSVTPQCHPILPLLVDFGHARRCLDLPVLGREQDFRFPDDAARHLADARATCQRLLGRTPDGLWPSEGSVSPEVWRLAARAGFAWLASDELVLARSARDAGARVDGPWAADDDLAGPRMLFRDHDLSDRIGFHYQHLPPGLEGGRRALDDLLGAAAARWGDSAGPVPVILDGENPWEAFVDAGEGFLTALFDSGAVCSLDTAAQAPAIGRIARLHTGSWIDADFRIWAGDEEDRQAWRLLFDLRAAFEAHGRPEPAWRHVANAESSDWFWWFGPEFHTEVADFFDALFRAHLRGGWQALGLPVPDALEHPVAQGDDAAVVIAPAAAGSLAEAARLPTPRGGAMTQGRSWLRSLRVALGGGSLSVWAEGGEGLRLLREGGEPLSFAEEADAVGWRHVEAPCAERRVRLAVAGPDGQRHPAHGWLTVQAGPAGPEGPDGSAP
ncbi:MAG: glycoside hydrolase [Alphaproteobacteria bacterium]|nr:glycoside hydrolase [Alphaproteobacteria bacterium]